MQFGRKQKFEKEEGMKKICVLVLALCLAVPAISHAGNATSRFDINIGGNIKIDLGWSDQTNGTLQAGGTVASRDRRHPGVAGPGLTADKKYGVQLAGAGETGLNFLVRGPDALGAKTSAFISGDFIGFWGGSTYNTFDLVVASINLDWANTSFTLNQGGQVWGKLPTWSNQIAWAGQNLGNKGAAPNLINAIVTQRFGKEWNVKFGISSDFAMNGTNNFPVNTTSGIANQRSEWPYVQAAINYSSGACGKVGPWQLTFGVAGVYGRQKEVFTTGPNNTGRFDDESVDSWVADFKFLVPIIPEKNGNKAGALYVDGAFATEQNAATIGGPITGGSPLSLKYNRGTATDPEYASPHIYGWSAHAAYFIADPLSIHAFYGYGRVLASNETRFVRTGPGTNFFDSTQQYAISMLYDVNAAIRVGIQYDRTRTKFPTANPGFAKHGTNSNYRFAAYYFF